MRIAYNKVIYEPQSEPVTLDEAKNHLRVDHSDEDQLIDLLIQAAREMAEKFTGRSFITQTRQMKLDCFPGYYGNQARYNPFVGTVEIHNSPLIALTGNDSASSPNALGIAYYNESEVLTTTSTSDYWVDNSSNIPRLVVKNSWPSTYTMPNAVIITYTAGYGARASVPAQIKQAMLLIIGHLYENRETTSINQLYEIPLGAQALLSQYVIEQSVIY